MFQNEPNIACTDEQFIEAITYGNGDSQLETEITEKEIVDSVRSLRGSWAAITDGVSMEMFKSSTDITIPYLKQFSIFVFDTGQYPAEWKGDRSNPNNYRAITVVTSISKIFTNPYNFSNRLSRCADAHGIIDEAQTGFRS